MFGNESTYTDVAIAPYLTYATQAQNGYTVGAGVNIPLDGLFDLTYATATSQLNILKLNAEALMLANVQYSISEKDFSNGAIDSGTLSSEKSRQSDAQEKFENSKFELSKSLMILELVTHTPILRNK